jgi:hypothetical protein
MDTRRDLIVAVFCVLWLISNIVLIYITKNDSYVVYNNIGWIAIFTVITAFKCSSKKFRNWLLTPLKKLEKK